MSLLGSFSPVNHTQLFRPKVDCLGGRENTLLFTRNTVMDRSFDLGSNLTEPQLRENLLRQQRELDALYRSAFELCGKVMGDQLSYMGTTTVARDFDFITTVLEGPDSLINYYGGSYGSVLGQYLVNMQVILLAQVHKLTPLEVPRENGAGFDRCYRRCSNLVKFVLLSRSTSNNDIFPGEPPYKWYRHWLQDTDATYDMFLRTCTEAGPSKCALAEISSDPSVLKTRIEEFLDQLYLRPISVPYSSRPGILTAGLARKYLLIILELPTIWKQAATILANAILKGDASAMLNKDWDQYRDFERSAVSCNDQDARGLHYYPPSDEEIVDELLYVSQTITKLGWGVLTSEADSGCQHWYPNVPEPPERFTGPWDRTLVNTMLILSNTVRDICFQADQC